jgi:hypothetical protein
MGKSDQEIIRLHDIQRALSDYKRLGEYLQSDRSRLERILKDQREAAE